MKAKNPKITEDEIALIKSAQTGNMSAFNKLFHKYEKFTTQLLYDFIKDYDEARDINNLVWLKVYNKLSKFTQYSSFGGWLRILTNRTAIDYLRELKPNKYVPQNLEDSSWSVADVSSGDSIVDEITYDQVLKEFDQLPEDVRKVFKLYYVNNLTVSEINKATKIPTGTIKSHLSRNRAKLKQRLTN